MTESSSFDIKCKEFLNYVTLGLIVEIISEVYERALNQIYDPEFGFGECVFGTAIYSAINKQIRKASEKYGFEVVERYNDIRIKIPSGQEFSFRRVSSSYSYIDDIERSFPRTSGAGMMLGDRDTSVQLSFPLEIDCLGDEHTGSFIIAHNGDSETGLNAIYICQVGQFKAKKIVSWSNYMRIYQRDEDSASYASPQPPIYSDEVIEVPSVKKIFSEEIVEIPVIKRLAK